MKEIKFKVLLNKNSANPGLEIIVQPWSFKAWDKVDLETLRQFTGFQDKNGNDIYYDDFVFFKSLNMQSRVNDIHVAWWIIDTDKMGCPMEEIEIVSTTNS